MQSLSQTLQKRKLNALFVYYLTAPIAQWWRSPRHTYCTHCVAGVTFAGGSRFKKKRGFEPIFTYWVKHRDFCPWVVYGEHLVKIKQSSVINNGLLNLIFMKGFSWQASVCIHVLNVAIMISLNSFLTIMAKTQQKQMFYSNKYYSVEYLVSYDSSLT